MNPSAHETNEEPIVLLIDDSIDVHRLLAARLRNEPLVLMSAESGAEGLRLARELIPATVLLDLDMPEVDGFEVLRGLKDDPATADIPVVVLSGLTASQDKVTAFDLGAIDYITKPFDITELRVRVRSALRMHNLVQMLAQRAQIDGLSGLWNRAYFDHRWEEETAAVARHGRPLTIALIDLDHFKSINDTYGHPAGDTVIQGLAAIVGEETRASDICCRYGGEEFAIIMPDTAPTDGVMLCERIRQSLKAKQWARHPNRQVTGSFGVVGVSEGGNVNISKEEWLEKVDQNLYKAKKNGRDRVEVTDLSGAPVRLADTG